VATERFFSSMPFPNGGALHVGSDLAAALETWLAAPVALTPAPAIAPVAAGAMQPPALAAPIAAAPIPFAPLRVTARGPAAPVAVPAAAGAKAPFSAAR